MCGIFWVRGASSITQLQGVGRVQNHAKNHLQGRWNLEKDAGKWNSSKQRLFCMEFLPQPEMIQNPSTSSE